MYKNDNGVNQDYKKIFESYSVGVEQRDIFSLSNLDKMYCYGKSLKQDNIQDIEHYLEKHNLF